MAALPSRREEKGRRLERRGREREREGGGSAPPADAGTKALPAGPAHERRGGQLRAALLPCGARRPRVPSFARELGRIPVNFHQTAVGAATGARAQGVFGRRS